MGKNKKEEVKEVLDAPEVEEEKAPQEPEEETINNKFVIRHLNGREQLYCCEEGDIEEFQKNLDTLKAREKIKDWYLMELEYDDEGNEIPDKRGAIIPATPSDILKK